MAKPHLKTMDQSPKTIDDDDNPELTEQDFARGKPFKEVFPEQYKALVKQGGRPRLASPKVHIGLRLAADVVTAIRASGRGYKPEWRKCCATRSRKAVSVETTPSLAAWHSRA